MAEVLGIIASSVQIAGLAGQIAGIGLKIRALYQEIQGAPEELAFRLHEIRLLAGILSHSNSASPDVANFCERCLSELSLVLLELEAQVTKSRGIRHKVASTKVVFKKQLIQKLDDRLCRSVQLLQLAANSHMASSYGLILQNQDFMMSLLKTHFSQADGPVRATPSATLKPSCIDPQGAMTKGSNIRTHGGSTIVLKDSNMWSLMQTVDRRPRWTWTVGVPFVTGTLHFESNDCPDRDHDCSGPDCTVTQRRNENIFRDIRVRFKFPRWMSNKMLEVISCRSRIGWKQYIRMRNVFPRLDNTPDSPFYLACEDIFFDDIQLLRARIENREVTPWDEDERGEMMWVRLQESQSWLVHDIVGSGHVFMRRAVEAEQGRQAERRKLLDRLDDDNGLKFALLSGFQGAFNEFQTLKSSIWPDKSFYHPDFSQQRMQFAISIACSEELEVEPSGPSKIRSILGFNTGDSQPVIDLSVCNSMRRSIFHGLASKVAATSESQNSAAWHGLICEVLAHVTDVKDLSREGDRSFRIPCEQIDRKTAYSSLISESICWQAVCTDLPGHSRSKPLGAVTSACEKSITAWLEDLHKSGIDLVEYGRNEGYLWYLYQGQERKWEGSQIPLVIPSVNAHSGPTGPVLEVEDKYRLVRSLRLIRFQYGELPKDWKFWWNEPSDEFAGDFWRLVEIDSTTANMRVPGAWID
ncbi:hypothetical protein KVR01_004042 [Diaporthe batatas]|uniref:uncharacterized protein n=1 Tax=Diaporthe batatas TaxID=748121 RepID=UPI001D053D7D|nr:uncharacterized protein KVR01_004042 [Diaporthe batatas]KAG8165490.1 hypothetical protein KVR01_004042 [Diaporthe batatas]